MSDCCNIIEDNLKFMGAQVKAKFHDDLLIGTERSKKIIPDCETPNQNTLSGRDDLTDEEKKDIVIADPKFGMFSLMKYHFKRGHKNEILKKRNSYYCSHTFSLLSFLPIIIFFIQWAIYIALIAAEVRTHDGDWCPNTSTWDGKLIMFSVSLLYYIRSFFLWDNLTDRTRLNRMLPSVDIWVMLDTFQEFGFNLVVYLANIWIVFSNESVQEMILNSLAMEFLMNLDNEFEEIYFTYLPEVAVDIYDNLFVSFSDNKKKLEKRNKSCAFKCIRHSFYVPFKLLVFSLMIFPIFCLFAAFYGAVCK